MRTQSRLIAFAVVAVVAVGFAGGQQPFGGGFGKGKGGFDYFSLANNKQVRGEIKLTDEQAAKLPAAALKALGEVLDAGQLKRLKQIYLQTKGNTIYLEADVKKDLNITDDQVRKIQTALDTQAKEQAAMFESGGFDFERMQELQRTATDTVRGTLTEAQKATWTKLIGEPFEMQFGFGKKKD
jgi:hypothetical protein